MSWYVFQRNFLDTIMAILEPPQAAVSYRLLPSRDSRLDISKWSLLGSSLVAVKAERAPKAISGIGL